MKVSGGKRGTQTIYNKRLVVEYALSIADQGVNVYHRCKAQYPDIVKSNRLCHWVDSCNRYDWRSVPEKQAQRWNEVPDWWKRERGLDVPKKGRSEEYLVPTAVCEHLDKIVGNISLGVSEATPRSEQISNKDIASTVKSLVDEFNQAADERQSLVDEHNDRIMAEVLDPNSDRYQDYTYAMQHGQPPVQKAHLKATARFAAKFKKTWGWSKRQVNTSGVYMDYNHPVMVASRARTRYRIEHNSVDMRLVLNYDQLWKQAYRPKQATLHKKRDQLGHREPATLSSSNAKVLHAAKLGCAARHVKLHRRGSKRMRDVVAEAQEADVRLDPVKKCRQGMTVCTSIWGDGTPGSLALNAPEGTIPESTRKKLNKIYVGKVYLMLSNSNTHFLTADTMIELWTELFAPAVKLQRIKYGLAHSVKGLLTCDGFTGTFATKQGEHLRRNQILEEMNMLEPSEERGGWSAKGQPCDKVHAVFRRRCDSHGGLALGYRHNLRNRKPYADLDIGVNGVIQRSLSANDVVENVISNWFTLSPALCQWAWVSCGPITEKEMADMNGVTLEKLNENMEIADRLHSGFGLGVMPEAQPEESLAIIRKLMPGEVRYIWQIDQEIAGEWLTLPNVLDNILKKHLARYETERSQ